ncbi:MAG: putative membrane protein YdjX (TVP38/TMEM64 family), partial [Gammaproteobacteria bacterium]
SDDGNSLRNWFADSGWLGPVAVIALMTVAVVISPLPSAPIALASGAIYGHLWGTLYVVIGSLVGALIAFAISRFLRPEKMRIWLHNKFELKPYSSQHSLMVMVCVSRLLPFISFDLVSYAAGLSPLKFWRFFVATFIGIIPASFLLAHMGSELGSFDPGRIALVFIVLVLVGLMPLAYRSIRERRKM